MTPDEYYRAMDVRDPEQRGNDLSRLVRERCDWARLALAEIERPDGSVSWGVVVVLDEGYIERETAEDMPEHYAGVAARLSSRVQSGTSAHSTPSAQGGQRGSTVESPAG